MHDLALLLVCGRELFSRMRMYTTARTVRACCDRRMVVFGECCSDPQCEQQRGRGALMVSCAVKEEETNQWSRGRTTQKVDQAEVDKVRHSVVMESLLAYCNVMKPEVRQADPEGCQTSVVQTLAEWAVGVTAIVLACLAVLAGAGYAVYKYRLRQYMDSETCAIMSQYIQPLDAENQPERTATRGEGQPLSNIEAVYPYPPLLL
eukprot:jgi/Chlat1/4520/Chrsp29S04586